MMYAYLYLRIENLFVLDINQRITILMKLLHNFDLQDCCRIPH